MTETLLTTSYSTPLDIIQVCSNEQENWKEHKKQRKKKNKDREK
jgi:hypothetical protein